MSSILATHRQACGLAITLLTRLSVPTPPRPTPEVLGRTPLYYPWIGLLVGLFPVLSILLFETLFSTLSPAVVAAVTLSLWVWISGGLHLDGLADCADAWTGGMGSRKRTLEILKDPRSGPHAVVAVVLLLLLKFSLLQAVITADSPHLPTLSLIIAAAVAGRSAMTLLMITLPYVRPGGMGSSACEQLSSEAAWWSLSLLLVAMLAWTALTPESLITPWIVPAAVLTALFFGVPLLANSFRQRLGGITGDTLGAACEVIELLTLLLGLCYATLGSGV
ncbi:MAG: adenosylcobinamide-GDP ribazoletransferase [Magnetococcales bacterium]|nr:adenosylcobinamide-GDP ribazoletransferase [Magnetococcales bacterium]